MHAPRILVDGLVLPEAPRWHEGRLWFADMHDQRVMAVDLSGKAEEVVEVPGQPGGLGWAADGRLLVVSMTDRRLLRLAGDGLELVADLSSLASFHCNDMVVDSAGRAYIGNFGFDFLARQPVRPAEIVLVTPDGGTRVVARDLLFPNGMVITPDGRTLVVAETWGNRLTAFNISADGSLTGRRVWAQFAALSVHWPGPPRLALPFLQISLRTLTKSLQQWLAALVTGPYPDGICLDAEGAIWVASPPSRQVIRVGEGGTITHHVTLPDAPFACTLGGPTRRTLFVMAGPSPDPTQSRARRSGHILMLEVDVPGAGSP